MPIIQSAEISPSACGWQRLTFIVIENSEKESECNRASKKTNNDPAGESYVGFVVHHAIVVHTPFDPADQAQ